MNRRLVALVALGLGFLTARGLHAQAPPVPGGVPGAGAGAGLGGAAGGAAGAAGAPAAAAAPAMNLFSLLLPTAEQKKALMEKLCKCGLVKLAKSFVAPVSLYSGGVIGGCKCCPDETQPNPEALKKPETSAEGAAARIKKAEAEAAARRQAVRYLGTVDCERYPEAEEALINALRGDTNECVRYEAALALGRGCCCTRNTIEALSLTVSASRKDGNPAERSPRVRAAAAVALQNCLARYCEVRPIEPALLERPEAPAPPEVPPGAPPPVPGAGQAASAPPAQVVARARRTLEQHYAGSRRLHPLPLTPEPPLAKTAAPPEKPGRSGHDLLSIFRRAVATAEPPQPEPPSLPPPARAPVRTASRYPVSPPPPPPAPRPPARSYPRVSPPPPPAEADPEPARRLPPTGKRDLFNIFVNSMRPGSVR
jgi:hypothetical protein